MNIKHFIIMGILLLAVFGLAITGTKAWLNITREKSKEKLVLVFEESFENYREIQNRRIIAIHYFQNENVITAHTASHGKRSLKLEGKPDIFQTLSDTFGVILKNEQPLIVEFDIKILQPQSTDISSTPVIPTENAMELSRLKNLAENNPWNHMRAVIYFGCPGWVYGSGCYRICDFMKDNSINVGGKKISQIHWRENQWMHIRIRLEKGKINFSLNGMEHVVILEDPISYFNRNIGMKLEYVFSSGDGITYFDNIKFFRVVTCSK